VIVRLGADPAGRLLLPAAVTAGTGSVLMRPVDPLRTVLRDSPSFRAMALIGIPSARCRWRASAQSPTLITLHVLPHRHQEGVSFTRRHGGIFTRRRHPTRGQKRIRRLPECPVVGQTLAMGWRWRWSRGPKRGVALGVAVFGPQGFAEDADGLASLLGRRERLAAWLAAQGRSLEETPETLAVVDGLLDGWAVDPEIGPRLGNEVGLFLGCVIVRVVAGARWQLWPNGHPVVRLRSGLEYDVVALVEQRLRANGPALMEVLGDATGRGQP